MKYNIIGYLINDGIKNVFKNKKSTFAAMIIMLVTMLTVGICLIIGENVNFMLNEIPAGYPLEVYLDEDITVSQKDNLENQIRNIDNINTVTYVTKEEAFHIAKERFGEEVAVGYNEKEHPWPASFKITFTDAGKDDVDKIILQIENFDYVIGTTREEFEDQINALKSFSKNVNLVLGIVGVTLVLFSMVIIGNTIKLTVHARRKEISIMKYVGATNNFIRAPFMVEGIIIGLISSGIGLLTLSGLYVWLKNYVIGNRLDAWLQDYNISKGIELLEFNQMFSQILIIFLALGIGIGVLGSVRAMRKYLKV